MRQKVLAATFAVAMLLTTHDANAETVGEVVDKIRDGIDPHGAIEMWGIGISFPDDENKPAKTIVFAKCIEGKQDQARPDILNPESVDGGSAFTGLRYMTTLKPQDILAAGIMYDPQYRRTRPWKPPVMKPVLPDIPIPFFWLTFSGYLTKYLEWRLDGQTLVSLPPTKDGLKGNPRSLPQLHIEFFRERDAYLISKLTISKDGGEYALVFEGYTEVREGEFRPQTILASGSGMKVRATIDPIWYLGEKDSTAVFSMAAFQSETLSVANVHGSGETAKK